MGIDAMFDHTCDIFHILRKNTSPGYNLPSSPSFSYPEEPDHPAVPCHFGIKTGTIAIVQTSPSRNYEARIKLALPADTDIRLNDKIVDCSTGYEYTAEIPRNIRGNHIIVWLNRDSVQEPL